MSDWDSWDIICDEKIVAKEMGLADAVLFIKALCEAYWDDPKLNVKIVPNEGRSNGQSRL